MLWVVGSGVILGVGLLVFFKVRVGPSKLEVQKDGDYFPMVSGFNLQREEFQFPRDFAGKWNLIIVPFQREQQQDVNTWVPALRELEREYPGLVYYELPTIYRLPTLSRTLINEGMRAGIPDRTARERTVTLYLDKDRFKKAVDIKSEDAIHLLLVDGEGRILWRGRGPFSERSLADLEKTMEDLEG